MKLNNKLPLEVKKLAVLFGMKEEEVRLFPRLNEIREIFKDYNFGVLKKENLLFILQKLSQEMTSKENFIYKEGLEAAICKIKLLY